MNPENTLYRWMPKQIRPNEHKKYGIRYLVDGQYFFTECFYNKDFGWQGYDIFDFEWLEEVPEQEQEEVWNRFYEDWSGDKGCCENINDLKQQYILIKKQ